MTDNKILIITHSQDNSCIDAVSEQVHASGGTAIRFDVDRYPLDTQLSTLFIDNDWKVILDNGGIHHLEEISSVWYRRSHHVGSGLNDVIEDAYLSATTGEVKRTLYGMLEGLSCFQMERYSTYRRLDSKEEQLKVAAKHGLLVPPTCISNSPEVIRTFTQQLDRPVVAKMQSSFALYQDNTEQVVFTNEVATADIEGLEDIRYCPMVFQQKLEKKLELRVTVVGDALFAFSIDSQKIHHAQIDWRKEGLSLLDDWQPYILPPDIQRRLLDFMDAYSLNYGAIDLILTPDDQYYFLEVNPAGEYFWLDRLCDHAISRQIAAVLLGKALRRE